MVIDAEQPFDVPVVVLRGEQDPLLEPNVEDDDPSCPSLDSFFAQGALSRFWFTVLLVLLL